MDPSSPHPEALLEHAAFVRAVARGVLKSEDLVDDVEQETWAAAIEGGDRRKGPLRAWLAGIARRRAVDQVRREAARRRREQKAAPRGSSPSASDVLERAELGRRVADAVRSLKEPYQTVLLLRYFDDLPPREIARRLGVPVETVRTRIKRGLAHVRARLEAEDPEGQAGMRFSLLLLAAGPGAHAASTAVLVGGVLLMKKLAVGVAALAVILLGVYWAGGFAPSDTPPASSPGDVAPPGEDEPLPHLAGREDVAPESDPEPSVPTATTPAARSRFHGVVVDPDDKPIAGVRVGIDPHPRPEQGRTPLDPATVPVVTSDDEGRWALDVPGRDTWVWIRPRAKGWALLSQHGVGVSLGQEPRIVMTPACQVSVRVVERATRRPLEGVDVSAFIGIWAQAFSLRLGWAVDVGRTDEDGVAVLQVPGGPVRLLAGAEGFAPARLDGTVATEEGVEATLELDRGGTIEGTLEDPDGKPVRDASIEVFGLARYSAVTTTDGNGAFTFVNVPKALNGPPVVLPRTHTVLRVEAVRHPLLWHAERCPEPGTTRRVHLTLARRHALRGTVRRADGSELNTRSISLTVLDLSTEHGYASRPTMHGTLDDRGDFRFENLPPGPVEVSVRPSDEPRTSVRIEVAADGDTEPLLIELPGRWLGALKVRVLDAQDRPVAGARVNTWLADQEDPPVRIPGATEHATDDTGRLTIPDLPVGPTVVFVDAPGYAPVDVRSEVAHPAIKELVVRLGDGTITGRVVRPDGSPAHVGLRLSRTVRLDRWAMNVAAEAAAVKPEEDGSFAFTGVSEGAYAVDLEGPGMLLLSRMLVMRADDEDVRIVVATQAEASRLFVEVILLDSGTLEPVTGEATLRLMPSEGNPGYVLMFPVADEAGVYRSAEPWPPGAYTVQSACAGYRDGETAVRLAFDEATQRAQLLLDPNDG